ncbi:hypothetical protein ACFL27_27595 [candidate division CSSED10-310 bacterium]|uniref:Glutamine amidotransferase type-2 domain-containing protein n=1 Tax=candidate division CSSED10-310 bacterium TaxID=2855610 RepID=A0ABV6Z6I0_UNCC1
MHLPLSSLFSGDWNPYFSGVHAIAWQDGEWIGSADPRLDGIGAYALSRKQEKERS